MSALYSVTSIIDNQSNAENRKRPDFPPALLEANPFLANLQPGSLLVVELLCPTKNKFNQQLRDIVVTETLEDIDKDADGKINGNSIVIHVHFMKCRLHFFVIFFHYFAILFRYFAI